MFPTPAPALPPLDQPLEVHVTPSWRLLRIFLYGLPFAFVGQIFATSGALWPGGLLLALAALFFGVPVWILIAPPRYRFDDAGIHGWGLGRSWSFRWDEVVNFHAIEMPTMSVNRGLFSPPPERRFAVGFDASATYSQGRAGMRALNKALVGAELTLQAGLNMGPTVLSEWLNARRAKALGEAWPPP